MQYSDALREHAVKTARMIGRIATGIALAAMATSYMVQVGLLRQHQVGWSSFVIPISLDALAVIALMARRLPGLDPGTRRIASLITMVMASISFAGNTYGAHDIVAGIGHAVPVLGLLLAENLAGRVLGHAHTLTAQAKSDSTTATPSPVTPAVVAPVTPSAVVAAAEAITASALPAPVSPAPARVHRTSERIPGTGPMPKGSGEVISPLTGRVLTPRPPRA